MRKEAFTLIELLPAPAVARRAKGSIRAFTLIELLAVIAILAVLAALTVRVTREAYRAASLAVSANNLRQLGMASAAYLGDHDSRYWKYRENVAGEGVRWWFGFEPTASLMAPEGERWFDISGGPLGGYVPAAMGPDPSFALAGKPLKPKYRFGYIGAGYNVLLADAQGNSLRAWMGSGAPLHQTSLARPEEVVLFATAAQVNTFQHPASPSNPMVEDFYGIDDRQATVHFRHNGKAMAVFANGAAGLLDLDPSTLDRRAPDALIGRFAPSGSTKYLR